MIIFRIISTAAHSMEDVQYTLKAFTEVREKLDAGVYDAPDGDIVDMAIKYSHIRNGKHWKTCFWCLPFSEGHIFTAIPLQYQCRHA